VLNVASAGISGVVDEAVNARPDRGPAAYLAATLGAIWRYRNRPCRVSVDGEPWFEGEIFLLAVANGTCFGRGMRIAPEARFDDGEADVVLIAPMARWQLVFQMPRIYRGTHLAGARYVHWRRGREVRIEPLTPFPPFDLDGEVFAADAARFTLLPAALRVLL
jgi:diacylglycerol kinase (ATP)